MEGSDLTPCNEDARKALVKRLFCYKNDGSINVEGAIYVAKTFPDILLDLARLLTEDATNNARQFSDLHSAIREQLRPYFMFGFLLGKAPQIANLMYSYFENSSFQPLPEELFESVISDNGDRICHYSSGFDEDLLKEILRTYLKYLTYNPKWFSSVWNWSELGRIVASHPSYELRYLAACCLSIITKPTRHQHVMLMRDLIKDDQMLIDLQIRYRDIYNNSFQPVIETRTTERVEEFIRSYGRDDGGYAFCSESLASLFNVLLLKRDMSNVRDPNFKAKRKQVIDSLVPVASLKEAISKIAYSTSINKPCLIRGSTGIGKTAILDYIAAHTNRLNPPEYIKVQIGDQIDSKLIVGSYVCTDIPGQFDWQPGPLTQAMAYGSWIVFEDIDTAPSEMAQVIHSVIENGNLSCVSSCPIKLDSPHPDFRIIFTQRTRRNDQTPLKLGFGFVERLCDVVDIPELSDEDLMEVIDKKYSLGSISKTIIQLYRSAEKSVAESRADRSSKILTLRDLFKFCERVSAGNMKAVDEKYSSQQLNALLFDAIDCFLAHLPREYISKSAIELGQILNQPPNEVVSVVLQRKPELREESDAISVGRSRLEARKASYAEPLAKRRSTLAQTKQCLQLLESVSVCIKHGEPVLLVGETGVGKTTIVQHLANSVRAELVVVNLSQQSDSSDLLGGYRPVEMREVLSPIHQKFTDLFRKTYVKDDNERFLERAESLYMSTRSCSGCMKYINVLWKICEDALTQKHLSDSMLDHWRQLMYKARALKKRMSEENSSPMALAFSEGTLLRAVKDGRWILLDEINLAEPDVLQCLLLILDSINRSQVHLNFGENDRPIRIHPGFRIFACMNPSTDVGKRDLSIGIRNRFTEFFVDDVVEKQELRLIVESYVKSCVKPAQIESIVNFYQEVRARANILNDISENSPVYSLRTLCRALVVASQNVCHNMDKSLLESIKITFLQQLNDPSVIQVLKLIEQYIFNINSLKQLDEYVIPKPQDTHSYVQVQGFWIQASSQSKEVNENYIITKSVKKNMERLARIISLGQRRLPILIQGNTSVGKTSLIRYIAKLTGNKCYRINNHEHTDLQEYVGRYVLTENGELRFQEGLLVTAMKKGYWVILDELNLAPCELLEALNRVLDDNRELFIPETGEIVKAHSKFILFATQNPPHEYAGRKLLSRAFRNRFIELHFDEIPSNELEEILQHKCKMAPKHAKNIVTVMKELQIFRRESGCFNGKSGFMTLRDLFRWGQRYLQFKDSKPDDEFYDWDLHLASQGLILLEGKVRTQNEADIVKSIIEKVFKRQLDRNMVYTFETSFSFAAEPTYRHIHFTPEFKRLFVQLTQALKYKEPVLLVGQTGCGKTTAAQLYAYLNKLYLIAYNCHFNTESSDFIGDVRPGRKAKDPKSSNGQTFAWLDGPLVQAMRNGSVFLMDEISLADDAVLERINSVLEPDRQITITEMDGEEVKANEFFRFIATMNPGGDFGKKELSPALRNRFTEIHCHNTTDIAEISRIIDKSLFTSLCKPTILVPLINVMKEFLVEYYQGQEIISLRDILSWTKFLNKLTSTTEPNPFTIQKAIIEGAYLVFFDQFGTCGHNTTRLSADNYKLMRDLESLIKQLVDKRFGHKSVYSDILPRKSLHDGVQVGDYYLPRGALPKPEIDDVKFILEVPVVSKNLTKIARALQLDRPILLEGDPGAGKTSIVAALAKITSNKLVRINLSEQTDISDLFGSDLPDATNSTDDGVPKFCWNDGPMLRAIKEGSWILLDEMNLAPQSVLEGLNACFDHRQQIYIPELDKKFTVDRSTTRIFACQNPYNQGAARKGLPKSFVNRFTSIFIESHSPDDLLLILENLYPKLSTDIITKMIQFNTEMSEIYKGQGHEFNLRDLIYWCDLLTKYVLEDNTEDMNKHGLYAPERFVQFVYIDRLRHISEKIDVSERFERIFGNPIYDPRCRHIRLGEYSFTLARSILARQTRAPARLSQLSILKYQLPYLESIAKALEFNKMPILVGQPGVGKRSMVKILAGLTGNELQVVGANRDMDTVELLGSFEQKSFQRELIDLIDEAQSFVANMLNTLPRKVSATTWSQLYKHIWSTLFATSIRDNKLSKSDMMDAYRFQLDQMNVLIDKLQQYCQSKVSDCLKAKIGNLRRRMLYQSDSMYSARNFEWIDSILIKSIREGGWLMIEHANLMSPATLDRLNSLVEPNGSLCLNEKGSGPQGIETVVPHPNFRLILTMDPEHGELSRAMRNRGIEIFIRTRYYFEDFMMLLNQNGFEPEPNKSCMAYCIMQTSHDTHIEITGEDPLEDGSLLAYFYLNYVTILAHEIRRGLNVDDVLADLLISYYRHKSYLDESETSNIRSFVAEKLKEYRAMYVVDLDNNSYNWRNFRHDLVSMSGGDAILAMLVRENNLFWRNEMHPVLTGLLRQDEIVDHLPIVNSILSIKIFLELANHGDLGYRKKLISSTFNNFPALLNIINNQIDTFFEECVPIINNLVPSSDILPVNEMYVDTRNAPDLHYYLQSLSYKETIDREDLQNRWILSLHRISIRMIVELIQDQSQQMNPTHRSLWSLSELVRVNGMSREDLIKPQAEVVTDLYDLLNAILQFVSDKCFENRLVPKMLGRLFWIGYFICKLKKAHSNVELTAICNQIPMLWALTYQKVLVPLIKDCDLADLSYNGHKFSNRIRHICDFLDITVSKPGMIEKDYYNKVINMHAVVTKRCESLHREIDKFFTMILGKYSLRSQTVSPDSELTDNQAASGLVWSNSKYMLVFYEIIGDLYNIENIDDNLENIEAYKEITRKFMKRCDEYKQHELNLQREDYRSKCLSINKRRNALDQFAPIFQVIFIQARLSKLRTNLVNPSRQVNLLRMMTGRINGIIISPRYYNTVLRFLKALEAREDLSLQDSQDDSLNDTPKSPRQNVDMFTSFVVDHILENIVLDNQVVGWTKLRVTTSDLPSLAPLIPEYSPIISLVASYCLDISHLKLNSYQESSAQLDSIIVYLWRAYSQIKFNSVNDVQDIALAKELIHLRIDCGLQEELVGSYRCDRKECRCIDTYIARRAPRYRELLKTICSNCDSEDRPIMRKALRLIYFGFYNALEYAPMFTFDPALRAREKLEVYKSELAHIKLDLNQRNTLYYWKTGENLRLLDVSPEEAKPYPFSIRVLVERRAKLERSVEKLRRENTNRPKSDDGSRYYDLRKEVEVNISRYTSNINSVINDLSAYVQSKKLSSRSAKLTNLVSKCRMLIKNLERSIAQFKSDFVLYSDLTTNYLAGMTLVLQGLRRLYSRIEQKIQLQTNSFARCLVDKFSKSIMTLFSFNDFTLDNMDSVNNKRGLYNLVPRLCPEEKISYIQSLLLRSILVQLNQHIMITPSDINRCIPIVRNIADKFHGAWLERKKHLEEQRRKQEELYQYKPSRNRLGGEISYERQEFIDVCTKFPTYENHYTSDEIGVAPSKADEENFETELKIVKLHKSVDISMCIDICKAHYKFMKEASHSLLGQRDSSGQINLRPTDVNSLIQLESEILYTVIRQTLPSLDKSFDSLSLECHLLQANELRRVLSQKQPEAYQQGSLKSSIDILDEKIFDIYYDANAYEALKFQNLLAKIEVRVRLEEKRQKSHPCLTAISKLISRIGTFLIKDPMMKFVSGAHILLQKVDDWNQQCGNREHRMISEMEEIIELLKSWRAIELMSWKSSLHRVKRKYIDDTLCDLWFTLYEFFNDPMNAAKRALIDAGFIEEDMDLNLEENSEAIYVGFAALIKDFLEGATLGDYQIRLDLVFSFAIQTRFASLYEQARCKNDVKSETVQVDHEKLTIYIYNIYRQYQGLLAPCKEILEAEEAELSKQLNDETRIVAWQGSPSLWEIKNNFRISHRKLNKVMTKYLKVLERSSRDIFTEFKDSEKTMFDLGDDLSSTKLETTIKNIQTEVSTISSRGAAKSNRMMANPNYLSQSILVAKRMQQLSSKVYDSVKSRYMEVVVSLEETGASNSNHIQNFYSHKVKDLVLLPKDSKEQKAEKMKQCRQMYHSKKFAMQAVFKNLRELGVSYQRGTNSSRELYDKGILTLEPLRGMLQHQSKLVLAAASKLVDDSLIISCNEMYRQLITTNQMLLSERNGKDLTSDQMDRINGCALDMVLDIILHNRNAAMIYRHLMDVQASAARLQQLQERYKGGKIIVYNFKRVHGSIKQFNALVGRALTATEKLENLLECHRAASELEAFSDDAKCDKPEDYKHERVVLKELIDEINVKNSLMTREQAQHIQENLAKIRASIFEVSCELRDKLKCTIKNYLYSNDDIDQLHELYDRFVTVFGELLHQDENRTNTQPGSILGSIKSLLVEAEEKVKPLLESSYLQGEQDEVNIVKHPNLSKLTTRLQHLIKQTKLSTQQLYKDELEFAQTKPTSEAARRRLKPFNHIDSSKIRDSLRPSQVAKQTANCFMTLNLEDRCCNIESVVSSLTPIMSIYTQNVACMLNVILAALRVKLTSANQLSYFFLDLVVVGFGLPCKIEDLDGQDNKTSSKESDDNVGFGEGEGKEDASKKLEFESQLDELKKDDQDQKENQGEEEEKIEAHDDGVEMSEDIDAKAEGPEDKENGDPDQNEDVGEGEDDDDERLKELDKEFDKVDNDEGNLDEQLWDDKDQPETGGDDEEDLRQADMDMSINPEIDEKDMMAKNEDLAQSGANDAKTEEGAKDEASDEVDQDETGEDQSQLENLIGDQSQDESQIDSTIPEEDSQIEVADESVEMLEDSGGAESQQEEGDTVDPEEIDILGDDENSNEPEGQQDDEADNQEAHRDDQMKSDEHHPGAEENGDGSRQAEMDTSMEPEIEEKALNVENEDPSQSNDAQESATKGAKGEPRGDDEADRSQEDEDDESAKSGKRSQAERSAAEIKRQKIAAAPDDGGDRKDTTAKQDSSVQHVGEDKANTTYEVIDLADSDDDYLLDGTNDKPEEEQSKLTPSSKPNDLIDVEDISSLDGDEEGLLSEDKSKNQSSYNTNLGLLKYISHRGLNEDDKDKQNKSNDLMERIDNELNRKPIPEHESLDADILTGLWQECTRRTGQLVHELCQQLQIVLQPTKMSKYKGDYKSGKRLNMRKIISYIASHYRRDKIWLRRTKPCKRTYNISIAVDNSSSMSENNCRQMTYQSLALLAKSLFLIEAGSLQVVSFGEQVRCIHEFGQPYVDAIGAQWLRELRFKETRTSYGKVLKYSCESFAKQALMSQVDTQTSVNQLLIIISDGRNVTSEAEDIKQYQKQLKSMGVLTLFVIIDDLTRNSGKSIVDVKSCVNFGDSIRLENYMDMFPFPFYVLLRQLESMPSIMGDALRQWFELVVGSGP